MYLCTELVNDLVTCLLKSLPDLMRDILFFSYNETISKIKIPVLSFLEKQLMN